MQMLHIHAQSQLCLVLCDLMDCSPQTPLFMELPRQEYWSGLPFSTPGYVSCVSCIGRQILVPPGKPQILCIRH